VPNSASLAPILVPVLIFGVLIGIPLAVAWLRVRQDGRGILAEGVTAEAVITTMAPRSHGRPVLYFDFQPDPAGRAI
jgi:hypothetical protein